MEIALTILAWIGIVLGALLGLLLLVPLHACVRGRASGLWGTGHVRVSWAWFVLVLRIAPGEGGRMRLLGIPVGRFDLRRHDRDEAPVDGDAAKKPDKHKLGPSARKMWASRRVLWRALMRLVGTLHLRGRLAGQLGLGDPADTAMLELALGQLRDRVRAVEWRVECDYMDEVLELEGEVRSWIWPVQVAVVILVTMLDRDVRRALRAGA